MSKQWSPPKFLKMINPQNVFLYDSGQNLQKNSSKFKYSVGRAIFTTNCEKESDRKRENVGLLKIFYTSTTTQMEHSLDFIRPCDISFTRYTHTHILILDIFQNEWWTLASLAVCGRRDDMFLVEKVKCDSVVGVCPDTKTIVGAQGISGSILEQADLWWYGGGGELGGEVLRDIWGGVFLRIGEEARGWVVL